MALYTYVRETNRLRRKVEKYVSYGLLVGGSLFLFWSFYPIVSFEIYSRLFIDRITTSPIPSSTIASSLKTAQLVSTRNAIFSTSLADYTQAGIWFPALATETRENTIDLKTYSMSIPKLNIKDAKVIVGGEDLKKGLIHYLPKQEPGELGNIAIFGHSTLPQLYRSNNDYESIFTYLASLKEGDDVFVDVGDLRYVYEIYNMFIVKPDKISVLDQQYDDSYLTLITCTPPGTYLERLVVKARLKKS